MVAATKATYRDEIVDLPVFILKNRDTLVLKPNDDSGENHTIRGWETDDSGWDRALKRALASRTSLKRRSRSLIFPSLCCVTANSRSRK